jgi:DEAD/DEAH box helicase domain-containing protein
MRYIVFDIETVGGFRGSFDPAQFELTICCTYDSATDSYDAFLKEDQPRLWKLLEGVDALVGFNSDHFDIPILNNYYPGDLSRIHSIDIMKEVQGVIDRRIKLDMIAEGTLGLKKIANGAQAGVWWREGNIEKLREYCMKDVELTKRVFDYALEKSLLKYKELGKVHEIKLDTSGWLSPEKPKAALTHTLGF